MKGSPDDQIASVCQLSFEPTQGNPQPPRARTEPFAHAELHAAAGRVARLAARCRHAATRTPGCRAAPQPVGPDLTPAPRQDSAFVSDELWEVADSSFCQPARCPQMTALPAARRPAPAFGISHEPVLYLVTRLLTKTLNCAGPRRQLDFAP